MTEILTEVQIYLFAPRRLKRKWVRRVLIEEANYTGTCAYAPGEKLLDADVECAKGTEDRCMLIRGRVEGFA